MKTLNEMFAAVIFANECDSNEAFIHRFSDPDGVRCGKSGWSFGRVQWDTQNNATALACLIDCDFTQEEIRGIVAQTINVVPLAARLIAHKDIIEKYDAIQLGYCINSAMNVITQHGIPVDNPNGILALADYVNQYGSIGKQFVAFMESLKHSITAEDVLTFKLDHTVYGKKRPADCRRRYTNLIKVVKGYA